MSAQPIYPFRNPEALIKWTRWSVQAQMVIAVIAVYFSYLEYQVLTGIRDDTYALHDLSIQAAHASDLRQHWIALLQLFTLIVSGFLILRWIHRVNWNARALGARGMDYTPGWSIGWYFIPIANLFKPYQAMREIWQASVAPANWSQQPVPALLRA